MTDKMLEAFERDHGPLCADKDMQKYFARHEGAMKWAWQAARTVPEGYVMVPVEPTTEMLKAGERGIGVSSYVRKGMTIREYRFFKSGWDAMLAAAPKVSA